MFQEELINKHKAKIINAAVILICLFIALKVYGSQVKTINSLEQAKDGEAKKNDVMNEISVLDKRINAYSKLFGKLDSESVINSVNNIAKISNIDIVSVRPGNEQKGAEYIKIPLEVVIDINSFNSLGNFVKNIENDKIVYVFDGMELRAGMMGDSGKPKLSATLRLNAIASSN